MLLVYPLHYLKVFITLALGLVVMRRTAQTEYLALLLDAHLPIWGYQSSAGISIPNFLDTRFANIRASESRESLLSMPRAAEWARQRNPVASPDLLSCADSGPSASPYGTGN